MQYKLYVFIYHKLHTIQCILLYTKPYASIAVRKNTPSFVVPSHILLVTVIMGSPYRSIPLEMSGRAAQLGHYARYVNPPRFINYSLNC